MIPEKGLAGNAGRPLTLDEIPAEIERHHQAAQQASKSALTSARDCGRLLLDAKTRVKHGAWAGWLQANFSGSDRQARGYMQIAQSWSTIEAKIAEIGNALPIRQALNLLAQPKARPEFVKFSISEPDEPREQAIRATLVPVPPAHTGKLAAVQYFCPNCGSAEADGDGDCVRCHEPTGDAASRASESGGVGIGTDPGPIRERLEDLLDRLAKCREALNNTRGEFKAAGGFTNKVNLREIRSRLSAANRALKKVRAAMRF